MENSLIKKNANLVINAFLYAVEDKLEEEGYNDGEIEGLKQKFLKEIQ